MFNLSESFFNFKWVLGVKIKGNLILYIFFLKKMIISGLMMFLGYGGGMVNMEYMILIGLVMVNFLLIM